MPDMNKANIQQLVRRNGDIPQNATGNISCSYLETAFHKEFGGLRAGKLLRR